MSLKMVPCRMDGCTCGLPHPAYDTCNACRGRGHIIGGDAWQPCPSCRLRFIATDYPHTPRLAADQPR